MAIEGCDYSYSHPTPAQLKAAGMKFVVRYIGTPGSGKNLTKAEADALQAAGLQVVANYEAGSAGWMNGGRQVGIDAAKAAHANAVACGMPPTRPIYFSCDFNASYDQWKNGVKPCLQGAASVIGWGRVGMYGGLEQIDWAHNELGMDWLWQSLGWSYGQLSKHAVLQQWKNGQPLGAGTVDFDHAFQADYGQWAATQEDLSIVDDATKAYLEGKFNSLALLLMRGDETTDPAKDTHPNNIERTRQDIAAVLAAVKAIAPTLDPAQLEQLAALVAAQLVIKGAGYTGTVDLSPKPAS